MQPLYVELTDEITTVISRMKEANDTAVALVVPKGAILLQSAVNLKLAKRAAAEAGKELTLITTDKIGRNLSAQVGIPAFSRLNDKNIPEEDGSEEPEVDDAHVINGVKIHRYYEEGSEEGEEGESAITPIVPKEIMKEAAAEPVAEEITPIVVRAVQVPAVLPPVVKDIVPAKEEVEEIPPTQSENTKEEEFAPTSEPEDTDTDKPTSSQEPITPPVNMKEVRRRNKALILAAYLVVLLLLASGAVAAYVFPKTTVTITVKPTVWSKDATVTAKVGATASSDGTAIPAQILTGEVSESQDFKATGTADIGNKATGTAQLFNSLGSSVSLPAGARIQANGQFFTTDSAATIPAATASIQADGTPVATPGNVTVNITAEQTGPDSNMSSTSGTVVSPATNSYARIISTAGGTSKTVNIITATDIANAKAALSTQLQTDSAAKLADQVKGKDYLYDAKSDQYTLNNFSSTVAAGAQVDSATVKATGDTTRLVIDHTALLTAAQTQAKAQAVTPDATLFVDSTDITNTAIDLASSTATITTTTKGRTSPTIMGDVLQNSLIGKKLYDGVNLVKTTAKDNSYTVSQSPTWWPLHNFPLSGRLLKVQVIYE